MPINIFVNNINYFLIKISKNNILLKFNIIITFLKPITKPNTYTFNLMVKKIPGFLNQTFIIFKFKNILMIKKIKEITKWVFYSQKLLEIYNFISLKKNNFTESGFKMTFNLNSANVSNQNFALRMR